MSQTELDAEKIRARIAELRPESVHILREVLTAVRTHGAHMSQAQTAELAKILANKAKSLAKTEEA